MRERAAFYEAARVQWIDFQKYTEPAMLDMMDDLRVLTEQAYTAHGAIVRQQQALVDTLAMRTELLGKLLAAQTDLEEACGLVYW